MGKKCRLYAFGTLRQFSTDDNTPVNDEDSIPARVIIEEIDSCQVGNSYLQAYFLANFSDNRLFRTLIYFNITRW